MQSTKNFSENVNRLSNEIKKAKCVLIGAGAGLSSSAGFDYTGRRFHQCFADFIEKYGLSDMYSGGFYPFASSEEFWAYWSRYIYINRYMDVDNGTYRKLFELVMDKDYFVLTTNVDHQFQKAGFDKNRLFYTQGDYGLFQCAKPCHHKTYDNEDIVRRMLQEQENMRVPTGLVPICPKCGRPMVMNLRCDSAFVEDDGWHIAKKRYEDFLARHQDGQILLLELGVGMNTPVIIKYPFWELAAYNPKAVYAAINKVDAYAPPEIENRSVCVQGDIGTVLQKMA